MCVQWIPACNARVYVNLPFQILQKRVLAQRFSSVVSAFHLRAGDGVVGGFEAWVGVAWIAQERYHYSGAVSKILSLVFRGLV